MTLGDIIVESRKDKNLSQRALAALIKKENRTPISAAYLNDIEHGRRHPDSHHMINQFACALDIEPEILYFLNDKIPPFEAKKQADRKQILNAWRAFENVLHGRVEA